MIDRRCALCQRELVLDNGRRPFDLFGDRPPAEDEVISYRPGRTLRFCDDWHRLIYESWESNPESR